MRESTLLMIGNFEEKIDLSHNYLAVPKKVAHSKNNHKNAKNPVKLSYLAQKLPFQKIVFP